MLDWLSQTPVQAVLSVLVLLALCTGAYFLLAKLRESNNNTQPVTEELLKNFEEMRQEGDISDLEYRNIRSVLGEKQVGHADDASQPT